LPVSLKSKRGGIELSDQNFYVGAEDPKTKKITGYVPAKFLMRNGMYVMDPTPGGSQQANLYSDGLGIKTGGRVANPNNYLIVPANYTEQQAKDFAAGIADTWGNTPGDETGGAMGLNQALANMAAAFAQGGSQDLQRHPQWGIPKGSFVPAFISSASNHLGYVTALGGLPKFLSEFAGGVVNEYHHQSNPAIDDSGPYWLSRQNHANISQGFSDGLAASKPPSPFNDYGYGPQAQRAAGQIGDANGLGQVNGNNPPASVFDTGAPTAQFDLPDQINSSGGPADWAAALAGVDPQEPARPGWPPLADRPIRYLGRRAQ
jgi:hypothetical protein